MYRRSKTPPPYRRIKKRYNQHPQQQEEEEKTAGHSDPSPSSSSSTSASSTKIETKTKKTNTIPKKMAEHDPKEAILRCANRIAPYSFGVDTLLRTLRTVRANHQNDPKFRTIDMNSAAFRRSLRDVPGVTDFLRVMNFCPTYNDKNLLRLTHFDPAAFFLGISALEEIQESSSEYAKDKSLRLFQKEIDGCLTDDDDEEIAEDEEELAARKYHRSKLPSEPTVGGSPITVEFGLAWRSSSVEGKETMLVRKITRRFDSDDTLGDVIHWLGTRSSEIPRRLQRTKEWTFVDRNTNGNNSALSSSNSIINVGGMITSGNNSCYGYQRLDANELSDKTLHYIGCWPSGRIAIVPVNSRWFLFSKLSTTPTTNSTTQLNPPMTTHDRIGGVCAEESSKTDGESTEASRSSSIILVK